LVCTAIVCLPHRISSYRQTTFPTACSVRSGVGTKGAGPELPFRHNAPEWQEMCKTGDAGYKPQIGTLERKGINKGKGLSVPSPYFGSLRNFLPSQKVASVLSSSRTNNFNIRLFAQLSAEPESNKRLILFAHEQSHLI